MGVTNQTLRNLRKIQDLLEKNSLLAEYVFTEKIAPDTARKAYQEHGEVFLKNLEKSYQYSVENNLPSITPKAIEISMLSEDCGGALNNLSGVLETFAEGKEWREKELKSFVSLEERKKAREEVKEFWQGLNPRINTLDNSVDLGTISLDEFKDLNTSFQNFN